MEKNVKLKKTLRNNYVYSDEQEDWVEGVSYLTQEQRYDVAGHLVEEKSFNRDGEQGEHNEYVYNDQGQLTETLIYYEGNELAERHAFTYGDDGKLLTEKILYQESYADYVYFTYDSNGNLIERRHADEDGEVESQQKYVYDGPRLMQETSLGSEGEMLADIRYEYDENGRLVKSYHKGREDHEEYSMVYEYDEAGNRDCVERYNKDGQIMARTTMTHDAKGNVVESFDEDTAKSSTTKYQYDEKDHNILEEDFNEKEELNYRIERIYDDAGELIESLVYMDRHDQGPDQYYSVRVEFEYF